MPTHKEIDATSWTFAQAQTLCKAIEQDVYKLGYYTCLSGSVVYEGYSMHDLDLVFVPQSRFVDPKAGELQALLDSHGVWGWRRDSAEVGYREDPSDMTRDIYTCHMGVDGELTRKRVDVIIIKFPQQVKAFPDEGPE